MYRDEHAPAYERLWRVRAQLASARTRPPDSALAVLERQRRELARERRKIRRLRHPVLRMLPVTVSELGIVAGYGTVALVMAALFWVVLAAPFVAFAMLRERDPLAPAESPSLVDDLEARWNAAVDEFKMFPFRL